MTAPAPSPPPPRLPAPPRPRRLLRLAVQLIGFLLGLASLGWCISLALRPENKAQFEKLAAAPRGLLAVMLALSLVSLVFNGSAFWFALLPVRRLRLTDTLATNAIATFLGYLPLKAGAIARVLIHNRRDRIPVLTIGAWFAAVGLLMAVAFAAPLAGVIVHGRIDAPLVALVLVAEAAAAACIVLFARAFRGPVGIDRLQRFSAALHLAPASKLLRTGLWARLHAGFDMLASPVAVSGSIASRMLDAATQAARFVIAARILGVDLPVSQSLTISLAFFIVGVASPSGMAGLREGAATGLAGLLLQRAGATGDAFAAFAGVALLVTATEAVVLIAAGALGIAWLRPDRLLRVRENGLTSPAPEGSDPPPT